MKKITPNHQSDQQTVIGIDLGDKQHAVCIIDKRHGKILKEFSIRNRTKDLKKLADDFPLSLIAMEVSTHSPWISRLFEIAGLEVLVANARKVRAISANERKCDLLDARLLAKLARSDRDLLHPIQHVSEEAQRDLLSIKLRDSLVRSRVALLNSMRGALKALGIRLPSCTSGSFASKARSHLEQDHPELLPALDPSLKILEGLTTQIKECERAIDHIAQSHYPQAQKLQQIPGVGPITSLSFVLSVEDPARFEDARDIGAWLGLVPRRDQSGDTDKQLPISKTGNCFLRKLLVQGAQFLLGPFGPDCDLRRYGLNLADRGGKAAKKKATVAVARKLAVLMLTLWQKQSDYEPLYNSQSAAA